jgi:MYXO-CTERM domain-containing protein
MRLSWNIIAATLGLALGVGPDVVAYQFPQSPPLGPIGAVVLGGLIAMRACRRRS